MPLYAIEDLEPGMILSKDIKDRTGRTLLKADMVLQEKHLKILKTWGISTIEIQGEETQADLAEIIAQHPELQTQVDQLSTDLFHHVDKTHPFFSALIPAWKKFKLKELASKL